MIAVEQAITDHHNTSVNEVGAAAHTFGSMGQEISRQQTLWLKVVVGHPAG